MLEHKIVLGNIKMKTIAGSSLTKHFRMNPVFVVGLGRSGTTILLKTLKKHPQILSYIGEPNESPLIADIGQLAFNVTSGEWNDYYQEYLGGSTDALLKQLRRMVFETVYGTHLGVGLLCRHILKTRSYNTLSVQHWSAKIFPSNEKASGLTALFPSAKFIYIVRNGMDVVHSHQKFEHFKHMDFEAACKRWVSGCEKYAYISTLPNGLQVHHDELVNHPDAFFRRIYSFLELDYDACSVEFASHTHIHPLDQATQVQANVKETLQNRPAAYTTWTTEERRLFKAICGETMHHAGYGMPF